ncbi:glycosyltransferase [Methylocaldum szegediense]|nr:glycosyltransferase [Methylocaldum szegediense]
MSHVITGLGTGGAERMLCKLLGALDQKFFDLRVVSLLDEGTQGVHIRSLGIPLDVLELRKYTPWRLLRLTRLFRRHQPTLVQSWMYHANVAASLTTMGSGVPVVWNIRHSLDNLNAEKPITQAVIRFGAPLSRTTAAIVYNSKRSAEQHERLGYEPGRRIVIPNGFDLAQFQPSAEAKKRLRALLGIPESGLVIGLVARCHPMKDPQNFLAAARQVLDSKREAHFLMVGTGMERTNAMLTRMISETGLEDRVHLLGERGDIQDLVPGLDVVALASSHGEGFPNAIGEAMASGVPCAVTDVGDAGWLVGDTGRVVPPKNPEALAGALINLIDMGDAGRLTLGMAARQRVAERFSLDAVSREYAALYDEVARERGLRCHVRH